MVIWGLLSSYVVWNSQIWNLLLSPRVEIAFDSWTSQCGISVQVREAIVRLKSPNKQQRLWYWPNQKSGALFKKRMHWPAQQHQQTWKSIEIQRMMAELFPLLRKYLLNCPLGMNTVFLNIMKWCICEWKYREFTTGQTVSKHLKEPEKDLGTDDGCLRMMAWVFMTLLPVQAAGWTVALFLDFR